MGTVEVLVALGLACVCGVAVAGALLPSSRRAADNVRRCIEAAVLQRGTCGSGEAAQGEHAALDGLRSPEARGGETLGDWLAEHVLGRRPPSVPPLPPTFSKNGAYQVAAAGGTPTSRSAALAERHGLTPRSYCAVANVDNPAGVRERAAVRDTARWLRDKHPALGITEDELQINFISEGGYVALDQGVERDLDGFGHAGVDTLVSNKEALRPYLAPRIRAAIDDAERPETRAEVHVGVNEKKQRSASLRGMTIEEAVEANAGIYAWSKKIAKKDLGAERLPPEGEFFWATVYFNAGVGTARELLGQHGPRWYESKWKGEDFPKGGDEDAFFDYWFENSLNPQFNGLWRLSTFEYYRSGCK